MKLVSREWVWRKGGTQKKDGVWAAIRKQVSTRAIPSTNSKLLRQMALVYHWVWLRTSHPIAKALWGSRQKKVPTGKKLAADRFASVHKLGRNLHEILGHEALTKHGSKWFDALVHSHFVKLPNFGLRRSRKTVSSSRRRLSMNTCTLDVSSFG